MLMRKSYTERHTQPEDWEVSYKYELGGHVLTPGTVFTVKGEPGATFRFIRFVHNRKNDAEWIDCVGGIGQDRPKTAATAFRAFRPARITRVLRRVVRKHA